MRCLSRSRSRAGERVRDFGLKLGDLLAEPADVGVGPGDVCAGRVAPLDRRGLSPAGLPWTAQGFSGVVVAGQECIGVVVDGEPGIV